MKDTLTIKVSALVAYTLCLVLLFAAGVVFYVNHIQQEEISANRKADQRWCSLFDTLTPAYDKGAAAPNAQPLLKQIDQEFDQLSKQFGCS